MTQTAGQASDHGTVVTVISPEASQGKAQYSIRPCLPIGI